MTGVVSLVMGSVIADIGLHLAPENPIRPSRISDDDGQQEQRAYAQEYLGVGIMLQVATRKMWQSLQNCSKIPLRFGARQRRNAGATRDKVNADGSKQTDDEPAAWSGAGYAFA